MIKVHVWNPELVATHWNRDKPPLSLTGEAKTDSQAIEAWEEQYCTSLSSYIQVVNKEQLSEFLTAVVNEGNLTLETYPTAEDL